MGNIESSPEPEPIPTLTTMSPADKAASNLMMGFYRHATAENYAKIRAADAVFQQKIGPQYEMFLGAVSEKWNFGNPSINEMQRYHQNIDTLLNPSTHLLPDHLDKLWSLFHATGDTRYSDRIKMVMDGLTPTDMITQSAATWSYRSHVQQGYLQS